MPTMNIQMSTIYIYAIVDHAKMRTFGTERVTVNNLASLGMSISVMDLSPQSGNRGRINPPEAILHSTKVMKYVIYIMH